MADIYLSEFQPRSKLVTKETVINQPRFPIIDVHDHLSMGGNGGWTKRPTSELLEEMDRLRIKVVVDLDGGWGEDILQEHLDRFKAYAPERFMIFGGVDWSKWPEHGNRFGEWAAGRLREQARRGAQGLKIWKVLGLHVKDQNQQLVSVDDPRLDAIWATAGELKLPIMIHVADPVAFFDPLDRFNERWEELQENPDWHFPSPPFPSFLSIVEGMANVVRRFPQTTFIGAHVGCYAENLGWVGKLLDEAPNFYVDIAARIGELGRQPYTCRRFFIQYADRIMFGVDDPPNLEHYRIYFRFLETDDEHFNYNPGPVPGQGRWYIHGLYLPDEVLKKVYYQNAERILPL